MTAAKELPEATLADLEALPPGWRGEIIEGVLYAFPRPRAAHARVEGRVHGSLDGPFDFGGGGPGGWWILIEPGVQLPSAKEFSPDLAGWRRERLPRLPTDEPIRVVPDWICEIHSPRTQSYDLLVKRRYYASIGVGHLWYIDPLHGILTVSRLQDGNWLELGVHGPDETIEAEPFEAVSIELGRWYEGIDLKRDEPEG